MVTKPVVGTTRMLRFYHLYADYAQCLEIHILEVSEYGVGRALVLKSAHTLQFYRLVRVCRGQFIPLSKVNPRPPVVLATIR